MAFERLLCLVKARLLVPRRRTAGRPFTGRIARRRECEPLEERRLMAIDAFLAAVPTPLYTVTAPASTLTAIPSSINDPTAQSSDTSAPSAQATVGPQVIGIQVANTDWTADYLAQLQSIGLGSGTGYAIPTGTSAQLSSVPLMGLNQVQIAFSEDVSVQQASLSIAGINVASYTVLDFQYDPSTFVATWTLANHVASDTIFLHLQSSGVSAVTDRSAVPLDGEWVNGSSLFPSGNGAAGGDFQFRFNVLPGDANGDGVVNGLDISAVASNWLQTGAGGDANGDTVSNGLDIAAVASNWLTQTYSPTQLGSSLEMLLDPSVPTSMTFRPVRQTVAAQQQSFTLPITGANDDFSFQGDGTASKFMVSTWIRFDDAIANGDPIIGNTGPGGISWSLFTVGTASLELYYGNSAGHWAGSKLWSNVFNPGDDGILNNCWINLVFIYDGSQTGDENIAQVYINGVQAPTTPGNTLPAKVGNPRSDSGLTIGAGNGQYTSLSVCDVALCADVPADPAAAVADLWNNGFGVQYDQWPASSPTPLAYYKGDDNATADGVAPSGDMLDATGNGHTLTAVNSPGGAMEVVDWRDVSNSQLVFQFGYDPQTGYRSRVFEGEYSPTVRSGLPGVVVPPPRASHSVEAGYAYASVDAIALMGSSGSMFGDFVLNTTSTSNDLLSVSDDQTHLGDSNDRTQVLALSAISENHDLINLGNYSFANLHTYNAEGNPPVQLVGPGDIENIYGNELWGATVGTATGSSIVNGNTYFRVGQNTSLMLTNKNDGTYGAGATPGPYEVYVNDSPQTVYVDDGGAGNIGNIWATSYTNLDSIVLNGYAAVKAGVAEVYAVNGTTYGPMGISAVLDPGQQEKLRRWLLSS